MQRIICSHGFGVLADGRGMFTELAAALPRLEFVTFDYNKVMPNGDILVATLDEQAQKLQMAIDQNPDGSILLCHSQGCIIAGLVDLTKISKVVLLAPPTSTSIQSFMQRMMERPGSNVNLNGISKLPRSDGTVTLVPASYLKSFAGKNPFELYEAVANAKPTLIIRATEDEVVGLTNVNEVQIATHRDIKADHNFTGESRTQLIAAFDEFTQ
jgi:hypothetical protein